MPVVIIWINLNLGWMVILSGIDFSRTEGNHRSLIFLRICTKSCAPISFQPDLLFISNKMRILFSRAERAFPFQLDPKKEPKNSRLLRLLKQFSVHLSINHRTNKDMNIDVASIMNFVVRQDCNVNRKEIKQMLVFPVRESMIIAFREI